MNYKFKYLCIVEKLLSFFYHDLIIVIILIHGNSIDKYQKFQYHHLKSLFFHSIFDEALSRNKIYIFIRTIKENLLTDNFFFNFDIL